MKNEYRLVTFCVESQQLFSGEVGVTRSATLDFLGSVPELAQADGWLGAGGLSASAAGRNDLYCGDDETVAHCSRFPVASCLACTACS